MAAPVLIMAGGTGGHVFPALAVARELHSRNREVVWLGTREGIEARLVPEAGIPLEAVSVSGLRGKGALVWLLAPWKILTALFDALKILRRRRPSVVLGMGGFASGPGGIAAWLLRRPLVIHEQNSVAGLTNRLLAGFAREVLEAFPGSFSARVKTTVVGNPVRPEIIALAEPVSRLSGRSGRMNLLVLGGSQGALALNKVVAEAVALMPADWRPAIRHQAGARTLALAKSAYANASVEATVEPFIQDMAEAYAWADLVVCRAGALTVAELAAAGVAAIFVPFPAAVDDHQTANARYLVEPGAAVMLPQSELTPEKLAAELEQCAADRRLLIDRAERARALAKPSATEAVTSRCLALAGEG